MPPPAGLIISGAQSATIWKLAEIFGAGRRLHPELTGCRRVHELSVDIVRQGS